MLSNVRGVAWHPQGPSHPTPPPRATPFRMTHHPARVSTAPFSGCWAVIQHVVDSLVNEEDDLLGGAWLPIGIKRDAGQVAAIMPHQHNRLSLRPVVAGKAEACARNPCE